MRNEVLGEGLQSFRAGQKRVLLTESACQCSLCVFVELRFLQQRIEFFSKFCVGEL